MFLTYNIHFSENWKLLYAAMCTCFGQQTQQKLMASTDPQSCLTHVPLHDRIALFSFQSRLSHLVVISVVWLGSAKATQAKTTATANDRKETQHDVEQCGGPEGKQVERLVAVKAHICTILVVAWLKHRVDPIVACNEPAEEEHDHQWLPDLKERAQAILQATFRVLIAGQAS